MASKRIENNKFILLFLLVLLLYSFTIFYTKISFSESIDYLKSRVKEIKSEIEKLKNLVENNFYGTLQEIQKGLTIIKENINKRNYHQAIAQIFRYRDIVEAIYNDCVSSPYSICNYEISASPIKESAVKISFERVQASIIKELKNLNQNFQELYRLSLYLNDTTKEQAARNSVNKYLSNLEKNLKELFNFKNQLETLFKEKMDLVDDLYNNVFIKLEQSIQLFNGRLKTLFNNKKNEFNMYLEELKKLEDCWNEINKTLDKIKTQLSINATFYIEGSKSFEEIKAKVDEVYKKLLKIEGEINNISSKEKLINLICGNEKEFSKISEDIKTAQIKSGEEAQKETELGATYGLKAISIKITPAKVEVTAVEQPIAVIPPIIFSEEHQGTSSFAKITPERIFDEIKNFAFKLAPTLFILLLIIGGMFYLLAPVNLKNIQTGSEYIKWAVIGYFVLLVITGILAAVRGIFGGP